MTLGMTTRNLGAALAPLFAIPGIDERAVVMVALGLPMQMLFSVVGARFLARNAASA